MNHHYNRLNESICISNAWIDESIQASKTSNMQGKQVNMYHAKNKQKFYDNEDLWVQKG